MGRGGQVSVFRHPSPRQDTPPAGQSPAAPRGAQKRPRGAHSRGSNGCPRPHASRHASKPRVEGTPTARPDDGRPELREGWLGGGVSGGAIWGGVGGGGGGTGSPYLSLPSL